MSDHYLTDVFIDEGSNGLKVMWVCDGQVMRDSLPARVVQEALPKENGFYADEAYTADGDEWTVAPFKDGAMPTNVRSYQVSTYNRVLVHEALRRNGFGGKKVRITVTLPVGDFYGVKPRNDALINQKKANLLKPVVNLADHPLAEIKEVRVSPEGVPAWMNYLLDDDGSQTVEADESHRILVVDQGGTTIDLALIDGLGNIHKFDSVRAGGFEVADNLRPLLMSRFDRKSIETHQLDRAMRKGEFSGESIDEELQRACSPVESRILTAMEQFSPDSESLDAVVYVGGLSCLTADRLAARYGGTTIKGDEFTIVHGITKQFLHFSKSAQAIEHAEN